MVNRKLSIVKRKSSIPRLLLGLILSVILIFGTASIASAQRRGGFGGSHSFGGGGGGFSGGSPRSGGFNSSGSGISRNPTGTSSYGGAYGGGSRSYGSTSSRSYQARVNQIPPRGMSYTTVVIGGRSAYYYPGWGYSYMMGGPIIGYYDPYGYGGGYGYGGPMYVHTGPSWFLIFLGLFGGIFFLVLLARIFGGGRGAY
jgi:hypothetical protein